MTEEQKLTLEDLPSETPPEETQEEPSPLDFNMDTDFVGDYIQEQINKDTLKKSTPKPAPLPKKQSSQVKNIDEEQPEKQQKYQKFESAEPKRERSPGQRRLREKEQKFNPNNESNDLRVVHYGLFGLLYIFGLLAKMDFSFFLFPTFFIAVGCVGVKLVCQFFLSRQALSWSEALYTLGLIIGTYFIFYPLTFLAFSGVHASLSTLYVTNIFIHILILCISSAIGLKLSTNYEWSAIAWTAPVIGIWLSIVSRVGVHVLGL